MLVPWAVCELLNLFDDIHMVKGYKYLSVQEFDEMQYQMQKHVQPLLKLL